MALWVALAAPATAQQWEFSAKLDADVERLDVHACSDQAMDVVRFESGSRRATNWLRAIERSSGRPLQQHRGDWRAEDWQPGECLHTQIDLGAAAAQDRYGLGHAAGQFIRVSPDHWWWRPERMSADSRIRFDLPAGWSASVPWTPVAGTRATYRLGGTPLSWPLQTAFGRFEERALALPGGTLRVAVLPRTDARTIDALHAWIRSIADDLLASSGRLPVVDAQVLVVPLPGVDEPVPWGEVIRGGGPAVQLFVGVDAGPRGWRDDWTATHEFAHLLHPYLDDGGRWLAEGLASYYQNVLRARRGELTAEQAWSKLDAGFGRGRRSASTEGTAIVDVSRHRMRGSTMRIYWGGAAFWLEADVALRAHGTSLDAVLAAFAQRHGDRQRTTEALQWEPDAFVAALHAIEPAAGLNALYARHAQARTFPDLAATYQRLGLPNGGDAPDAAIRRAIMQRRQATIATMTP